MDEGIWRGPVRVLVAHATESVRFLLRSRVFTDEELERIQPEPPLPTGVELES